MKKLIILVLMLSATPSMAWFKLCNQSGSTLFTALAYTTQQCGGSSLGGGCYNVRDVATVQGWWGLRPNECKIILNFDLYKDLRGLPRKVFLAVQKDRAEYMYKHSDRLYAKICVDWMDAFRFTARDNHYIPLISGNTYTHPALKCDNVMRNQGGKLVLSYKTFEEIPTGSYSNFTYTIR